MTEDQLVELYRALNDWLDSVECLNLKRYVRDQRQQALEAMFLGREDKGADWHRGFIEAITTFLPNLEEHIKRGEEIAKDRDFKDTERVLRGVS